MPGNYIHNWQYEDELEPYLTATRQIYKDLISVVKDSSTGKLKVSSMVFKITDMKSSVSPLFPLKHPQNFCYFAIDPLRRNVNLFYHASDSYY
jgi:cilia- and flagella-associated protein 300